MGTFSQVACKQRQELLVAALFGQQWCTTGFDTVSELCKSRILLAVQYLKSCLIKSTAVFQNLQETCQWSMA